VLEWLLGLQAGATWLHPYWCRWSGLDHGGGIHVPPVRIKELPYLDVLSESVNNPYGCILGGLPWQIILPPLSLVLAY
jgi:hypothetical protein